MHQGSLLKRVIKSKGFTANYISKELNIHRNSITNKFKKEVLPLEFLNKIGDLINYDFSQDIPHLKNTLPDSTFNQPESSSNSIQDDIQYSPKTLNDCEAELFKLQSKYIDLLEKYNTLLAKY